MPAVAYFLDRSENPLGSFRQMGEKFVHNFIASASANRTLKVQRNPIWPDRLEMRGVDDQGRSLFAAWSDHPAAIVEGSYMVVFRDVAQDSEVLSLRDS